MANQHALVCFVCTFGLVSTQVVKYALQGQEINLLPSIFGQPDVILWKHDGKKVVFFDGMEEFVFRPYENRITLDWASAQLTIKDTTYEDSGDYELEVNVYKQVHRSQYTWELIDKVATPSISCEMSDTKQAKLVCSTKSKHPHLLDFRWSSRGNQQTGPNLTITVRNEDDDQVYRCDVSNPLTNETASFTAKDCFLDKRSAALLTVIISVIFAVVILLIILACVFRKRLRGSACFENTKKGVFKRRQSAADGSSQGDETTYFLGGASTLPSNQRLRPLIPSDWIDPTQGGEKQMDSSASNGSNKELTGDEGVESDAAIGLTASSTDPLRSPLASSDVNTTPELEDNTESQQLNSREEGESPAGERPSNEEKGSEEAAATAAAEQEPALSMATSDVNTAPELEDNTESQPLTSSEEGDSPAGERPSNDERGSEEEAAAGQEPVLSTATRGEDQQERITSASEDETQSDHEDDKGTADEAQSETGVASHDSLSDTPRKTNQDC
ncbi:uncharacterized protein LOC129187902 isoform X2 [Dunckerocampus dactyliophorus]|uniref:uncharacterized protein LOC129187902 isoform X2 n=1 Tax=Dunckerocampus dactyliophorus TaxID=161453 RepID=UPI002407189D|nr:uncharacterized protein LOC129187902 isoform X2 [Dunckerocampus dactyliophorus]